MEFLPILPEAWDTWVFGFPQLKIERNNEGGFTAILPVTSNNGLCLRNDSDKDYYSEKIKIAADKYFERHQRYYCIHFKTTSAHPKTLSVRIHGFFSELEDGPVPLEFLKLRLNLSMALHSTRGSSSLHSFMANSDISITSPQHELRDRVDGDHEFCIGNDSFIETSLQPYPNCTLLILSNFANPDYFLSGMLKVVFYSERNRLDMVEVCDKIAKRNEHSDLKIVASNGAEFPCHTHFLAAHSKVLATMIEGDFEESKSHKIEMVDMSEDGVIAFLDYLYQRDVARAMESSGIALELLQAGHKYDIPGMVSRIKCVLLYKAKDWFDVDVAMRLFAFVRNLEEFDDVKMKAVQVIKSKSRNVSKSKVFQDFFKGNSCAALELYEMSFSCGNKSPSSLDEMKRLMELDSDKETE